MDNHMKKLWEYIYSSNAKVLGIPIYGDDVPKWIDYLYNIIKYASGVRYKFMYRFIPKHQYHIIRTGLELGYHDYDSRILHGCMTLLVEYFEEAQEHQSISDLSEAYEIYLYWKIVRPEKEKSANTGKSAGRFALASTIQKEIEEADDIMMARLISIRGSLWN
jgi:hypothetical protein